MPRSKLVITIFRIIFIVLVFLFWHLTQNLIASYKAHLPLTSGIYDQIHHLTAFINTYLNEHKGISSILLILTSLEVDLLALYIFIYSISSKSARLFIGLITLMLIRQICQLLMVFPIPPGILWYDPNFPSLFVTYQISNDFFFSGHTALVFFAATALGDTFKSYKYISLLRWTLIVFQCSVVLLLRAHYFMDVFTAIFVAIVIYHFTQKIKLPYWLDMEEKGGLALHEKSKLS